MEPRFKCKLECVISLIPCWAIWTTVHKQQCYFRTGRHGRTCAAEYASVEDTQYYPPDSHPVLFCSWRWKSKPTALGHRVPFAADDSGQCYTQADSACYNTLKELHIVRYAIWGSGRCQMVSFSRQDVLDSWAKLHQIYYGCQNICCIDSICMSLVYMCLHQKAFTSITCTLGECTVQRTVYTR